MSTLAGRPTEKATLHFDFAHVDQSQQFTLHVCMESFPLEPHDDASRLKARKTHGFLRHVPDRNLSHYIDELPLPKDAIALVYVTRPVKVDGQTAEHTV